MPHRNLLKCQHFEECWQMAEYRFRWPCLISLEPRKEEMQEVNLCGSCASLYWDKISQSPNAVSGFVCEAA